MAHTREIALTDAGWLLGEDRAHNFLYCSILHDNQPPPGGPAEGRGRDSRSGRGVHPSVVDQLSCQLSVRHGPTRRRDRAVAANRSVVPPRLSDPSDSRFRSAGRAVLPGRSVVPGSVAKDRPLRRDHRPTAESPYRSSSSQRAPYARTRSRHRTRSARVHPGCVAIRTAPDGRRQPRQKRKRRRRR